MKNITKLLALSILAVGLAACATNKTSADLMANPKSTKVTLDVPFDYQKTYRILAERSRACFNASRAGNDFRTEENLDTTAQVGEVRYVNHNLFWGDDFIGYYIVKPKGAGKSQIDIWHPRSVMGLNDDQKTVAKWMEGGTSCPL